MGPSDRSDYETDTVNRAFQHDLVLRGQALTDSAVVFRWRSGPSTLGPQFTDSALAIDWIAEWLASGD